MSESSRGGQRYACRCRGRLPVVADEHCLGDVQDIKEGDEISSDLLQAVGLDLWTQATTTSENGRVAVRQ